MPTSLQVLNNLLQRTKSPELVWEDEVVYVGRSDERLVLARLPMVNGR